MKPTSITKLILWILGSASTLGVGTHFLRVQFSWLVPVPGTLALAIMLLVTSIFFWTVLTKNRLADPIRRLDPILNARTVALAFAGSRAGALMAGAEIGIFVAYLFAPRSIAISDRLIWSLIVAGFSLSLIIVSLWLEKICRVPEERNDK
jgi:TRAP-type C4-dicarboxylate transport system permease small subunit